MTQKQIDAARKTLPGYMELPWKDWTPEQKRLDQELDCREMINSCLTYGGIDGFWQECEWREGDKSYAARFIRELGRKRVEELAEEQQADFSKARIFHGVYEDSEGCSYNGVVWHDEAC